MRGARSMAAQLRACRCRACPLLPVRPVTTSASNPRRRKALASDVFTACYTAVMATAAVMDARSKDRRRRDLDNKIAETKKSLMALLEKTAADDLARILESPSPYVPLSPPVGKAELLDDICTRHPEILRELPKNRRKRLYGIQTVRRTLGFHWNPVLPDTRETSLERADEVMKAEEQERIRVGREPKTEVQMEKQTAMISDLVDQLMAEAWWTTETELPGSHPSMFSPDSANTMIRMLRSEGYPAYVHPDLDPAHTIEQRTKLNEVNLKILEQWVPQFRERLVAKICYNLLVCGVPPGIQNYNLLILGFSFLGEHNLATAVVDSFLYLSHMKPTEATYIALLHHYRLKGDALGFQKILRRMFGYDCRGIGLMRRTADAVARDPYLRRWVKTEDVARIDGYYIQRAPFTQNVAEAIMEGFIHFGMVREGAKVLAVCLQKQWDIPRHLLSRLFHAILTLLEPTAAKLVIRALLDNMEQAMKLLFGPRQVGYAIVRQLHHILGIVQSTFLPEETINMSEQAGEHPWDTKQVDDLFPAWEAEQVDGQLSAWEMEQAGGQSSAGETEQPQPSWDDDWLAPWDSPAPSRGPDNTKADQTNLKHLTLSIWIREATHHTKVIHKWLKQTRTVLDDSSLPLSDRLDYALETMDHIATRLVKKADKTEHLQRISKVVWLLSQANMSSYQIRSAENIICRVLAKQTPHKLRSPGHFDQVIPIETRINRALPYGTPGTMEHMAADCFRASQALDSRIKQALIHALPIGYARSLWRTRNDSGDVELGRVFRYFEWYLAGVKEEMDIGKQDEENDPFAKLWNKIWRRREPTAGDVGW
jgi:hypothetical protein